MFVVDVAGSEGRDAIDDLVSLKQELDLYLPSLSQVPTLSGQAAPALRDMQVSHSAHAILCARSCLGLEAMGPARGGRHSGHPCTTRCAPGVDSAS